MSSKTANGVQMMITLKLLSGFCMQVTLLSIICSTLFLRTRLHPVDEQNGYLYMSTLFFALIHMMFNAFTEMTLTVWRLPVFYKQRDNLFYPAWAFCIPGWIMRIPYSAIEALIWSCIVYFVVGLAPEAARFFRYRGPLGWHAATTV